MSLYYYFTICVIYFLQSFPLPNKCIFCISFLEICYWCWCRWNIFFISFFIFNTFLTAGEVESLNIYMCVWVCGCGWVCIFRGSINIQVYGFSHSRDVRFENEKTKNKYAFIRDLHFVFSMIVFFPTQIFENGVPFKGSRKIFYLDVVEFFEMFAHRLKSPTETDGKIGMS